MSDKPKITEGPVSVSVDRVEAIEKQAKFIKRLTNPSPLIEYTEYEKLKAENERLKSELSIADLKTHKEKTLRILALLNECDTLKAKLAEVEAERDEVIENWQTMKRLHDELEAENERLRNNETGCQADYANLERELTREREAAKVMREELERIAENSDYHEFQWEAAGIAARALAKADEIRGDQTKMPCPRNE